MTRASPGEIRRSIVNVLEYTYGPVAVCALFCWFFATSDPAQEVILGYLADLETRPQVQELSLSFFTGADMQRQIRVVLSATLLVALPFFAFWSAREALRKCGMQDQIAARWVPLLIPAMCLVAYPIGLWRAMTSPEARQIDAGTPWWLALVLVFVGAQFFVLLTLKPGSPLALTLKSVLRTLMPGPQFKLFWSIAQGYFVQILAIVFLGLVAWAGFFQPQITGWIGPIGMAAGFAAAFALLLGGLTVLSHRVAGNFPLILVVLGLSASLVNPAAAVGLLALIGGLIYLTRGSTRARWPLFVLAGVVAVYGTSHLIDGTCETWSGCNQVQGVPPAEKPIFSVAQAYRDWPGDKDGPLRIVAAQGGGLYAAYHTAYYLAARADADPDFAQSLFAVSGVSGGSVGGGIYWAIRQSGVCARGDAPPDCHTAAVDAILRRDFLTPALAGLFFRDNLDNVVPYSAAFADPIDRGAVLETELARAVTEWATAQDADLSGLFDTAITASWAPSVGAPLLMFNATRVDNGRQYVLSPSRQIRAGVAGHLELASGRDLTVGNAMVISARFPVVTPPARLRIRKPGTADEVQVIQLADGGYFDNSGLETVTDMLHALRDLRPDAPIEVIQFTADEPGAPPQIKGTLGAPLSAFAAAWRARRDLTAQRVQQFFPPPQPERFAKQIEPRARSTNVILCTARTIPHEVNFTVSWYLTQTTFDMIRLQIEQGHGAVPTARKRVDFDTILRRADGVPDCSTRHGLEPAPDAFAAQIAAQ